MRPWIAFFSQTGTEIHNLSNTLGIYPDAIVTNKTDLKSVNKELLCTTQFREHKLNKTILMSLPSKPVASDYLNVLKSFENPVITLHGYLRIIPKEICDNFEIYNLHPGLINKYPELKGFNPQERAFTQGYKLAGCVIHKVISEVDEGDIIMGQGISIESMNLNQVYESLHNTALDLWKSFFKAYDILERE
jgi:folate-dependent phosphoribosylglycinamide formyltransferase PurN